MSDLRSRIARMSLPLVAAACALLVAACARTDRTVAATRVASAAPTAPGIQPAPTPPEEDPQVGTVSGVIGNTSETAALLAPAHANGATPSGGLVPKPSR